MKILTKYIASRFLLTFLIIEGILSFIYFLIDFVTKIDNFLAKNVSFKVMVTYFLSKAPIFASQLSPVAVLISSVVFISLMYRRNEILILLSSGIGTTRLKFQIALLSAIIALISFVVSEFIGTRSLDSAQDIIKYYTKTEKAKLGVVRDRVWHRAQNVIFYCDRFIANSESVERPIVIFFDEKFQITKYITAKRGYYMGGNWIVEKGYEEVLGNDGSFKTEVIHSTSIEIPISPKDLGQSAPDPLLMNIFELKGFIQKVSDAGYDTTVYLVDLYTRISFPFIHIIMAFIGCVFPLTLKNRPVPLVVALAVTVCFLYLVVYGIFRSVALSGVMSPVFALSMPNIIFLVLGYFMNRLED